MRKTPLPFNKNIKRKNAFEPDVQRRHCLFRAYYTPFSGVCQYPKRLFLKKRQLVFILFIDERLPAGADLMGDQSLCSLQKLLKNCFLLHDPNPYNSYNCRGIIFCPGGILKYVLYICFSSFVRIYF